MTPSIDGSNTGNGSGVSQSSWHGHVHQARMDFEQLLQAMQSGNLGGAQQSYAAVQQSLGGGDSPGGVDMVSDAATEPENPMMAMAASWASLGLALQSGNLSSAQGAFSQLGQDAEVAVQTLGAHHPHRRHPSVEAAQAVYDALGLGAAGGALNASGSQGVGAEFAGREAAMQSGGGSAVQSLLSTLEQDLLQSTHTNAHHRHAYQVFGSQDSATAYTATAVTAPGETEGAVLAATG